MIAEVVEDPYIFLKGRYRDEELTYDKVEHQADALLERMAVWRQRALSGLSQRNCYDEATGFCGSIKPMF